MTCPAGAASTKCSAGLGECVSLACTIFTVYAGPQILKSPSSVSVEEEEEGENMVMSGMWPPEWTPSFTSASDISQLENSAMDRGWSCVIWG